MPCRDVSKLWITRLCLWTALWINGEPAVLFPAETASALEKRCAAPGPADRLPRSQPRGRGAPAVRHDRHE